MPNTALQCHQSFIHDDCSTHALHSLHLQCVLSAYLMVLMLLFAVGSSQVAPDAIREAQDHHLE